MDTKGRIQLRGKNQERLDKLGARLQPDEVADAMAQLIAWQVGNVGGSAGALTLQAYKIYKERYE